MSPAAAACDVDALEPVEREQLRDLASPAALPSSLSTTTGSPIVDPAVEDAADGDAPEVVARVEVRDEHLQRRLGIAARRRHVLDDRVEQRPQIRRPASPRSRVAVPARALV